MWFLNVHYFLDVFPAIFWAFQTIVLIRILMLDFNIYLKFAFPFILTEYGIYCIEVKNWSGKISLSTDGKSWVQQRHVKDSNTKSSVTYDASHSNVLNELKSKTQLLRNHLLRHEACLAEKFFFSRVVLVNPKTELDNSLWKENEIVTFDRYPLFLDSLKRSYTGKVASSIVPSFITGTLFLFHLHIPHDGLTLF